MSVLGNLALGQGETETGTLTEDACKPSTAEQERRPAANLRRTVAAGSRPAGRPSPLPLGPMDGHDEHGVAFCLISSSGSRVKSVANLLSSGAHGDAAEREG